MEHLKLDGYQLVPLRTVRTDDIQTLLGANRGVYACNFRDQFWYESHGFDQKESGYIYKKQQMFNLMKKGSHLLSFTGVERIKKPTKNLTNGSIKHFGNAGLPGRAGQLVITLKMILWMVGHRNEFEYFLMYNFHKPMYLAALFSKYILRKKLYIDFEDDYTLKDRAKWKNVAFDLIKHTPDKVICINELMIKHFENSSVETFVFNGFIDLTYAKKIDFSFRDGMTFLYGGDLGKIRGVDLLPDLVRILRTKISNFKIVVTGSGPFEKEIRSWKLPELDFLGFLSEEEYDQQLREVDACLVLKKPDHPFSKGSFPSKIENYSKYKKPIYHLIEDEKLKDTESLVFKN